MSERPHTEPYPEPGPDPGSAPDASEGTELGDPVEHLWKAAHEVLGAMRALIDAADAVVEQQMTSTRARSSPREPRLRRIDVG